MEAVSLPCHHQNIQNPVKKALTAKANENVSFPLSSELLAMPSKVLKPCRCGGKYRFLESAAGLLKFV
ncbi:MAG: hypothetical protein AAGD09_13295 [Cyanobacteria bacterium P01_F01_bin.56]